MLYLHDVWVNWFEGEENGYNVCHFTNGGKMIRLSYWDQVPLLKVDSTLYHYIENELLELPQNCWKTYIIRLIFVKIMNVCSKSIAL